MFIHVLMQITGFQIEFDEIQFIGCAGQATESTGCGSESGKFSALLLEKPSTNHQQTFASLYRTFILKIICGYINLNLLVCTQVNLKNIKYRGRDCLPDFIDNPPDIFELAFRLMKKEQIQPYPFINNVNNTSHDILQVS